MLKFLSQKIKSFFKKEIPEDILEFAESIFYEGDFGAQLTEELCARLRKQRNPDEAAVKAIISSLLKETIAAPPPVRIPSKPMPHITLILGVNGSGKTTTVAKLARYYQKQGENVLIVATDTFRAAGMDQMKLWAEQLGCGFVSGKPGGDPAAIAYDGITAALSRHYSHVLIDTSGRLHTHGHLLQELAKMAKVCNKACPGSPHEVLLTIDATLGGNTLEQVRLFNEAVPLSGLIFTKMDGSAKGGTLFRIAKQQQIPTKFVGYGESVEDLEVFQIDRFLEKLLEN